MEQSSNTCTNLWGNLCCKVNFNQGVDCLSITSHEYRIRPFTYQNPVYSHIVFHSFHFCQLKLFFILKQNTVLQVTWLSHIWWRILERCMWTQCKNQANIHHWEYHSSSYQLKIYKMLWLRAYNFICNLTASNIVFLLELIT